MNNVERFEKCMAFEPVDRLPMIEWAIWWQETLDRWYGEGLPKTLMDHGHIREHLGLDSYSQLWIYPRTGTCPSPKSHGASIITNQDEYLAIKAHLYPQPAFDKTVLQGWAEKQKTGEMVVWVTFEGFFWFPRTLFGIEQHLYAFYDKPELMHMINEDLLEYHFDVLHQICSICTPNFMTFAEDMSYNHGPMLSKAAFDEFLAPYYQRIIPEIKRRGILTMVDSDGDVSKLIPWLEEVGAEGILPLERMAGVNIEQIRINHPKFRMIGAFDKTIMHLGEKAMWREFERLLPIMKKGGLIPSVDHQTPPDVSLETYHRYISLLRKYCIEACL